MNIPSTDLGNWAWRLEEGALTEELKAEVLQKTRQYGRYNWDNK